ncbi:putative hydroxypyruvate isomerase [Trichonephila clavipes]|nr:putative hydroxypyruvate isomerase [Trichonephila clavipes]
MSNDPNEVRGTGAYDTLGMASRPCDEVSFYNSIHQSIVYAVATDCKKVHILAGTRHSGYLEEDLFKIYVGNLKLALKMLEEYKISAVIEPICNEVKENYFLDSFATALKAIEEIGNPNLELLLDFYHLHMIGLTPEESIPLCIKSTVVIYCDWLSNELVTNG